MIKAIIFDCFGVLTQDLWLAFRQRYFSDNPELDTQAVNLNRQADAGYISSEIFIAEIAKLTNLPVAQVETEMSNKKNVLNSDIFAFIQALKPTYKIGLLSNASENWLDELLGSQNVQLFDAIALSCDTGFVKPDQRAYQAIAEQLNVDLNECVFIDDQERYATGAADAGMQAIHFQDNQQTMQALNALLKTT